MYEEARHYGHEREAFAHSLLGFQTWRHRLADVATTIRAAEVLTYGAIDLYVKGVPENSQIERIENVLAALLRQAVWGGRRITGGV
jgi:alkylation response protein AidB-like acyl-CoA dehydrogenase